jgi:hypothetical protein
MNKRFVGVLSVIALCSAVALTGCARQIALHASNGLGATIGATYAGPISQPVAMSGVGLSEAVPSRADVTAAVPPETAFAKCSVEGSTCLGNPNVTATVTLARVTSTVDIPDQLQNRLVYVIRWDGFRCSSHGPNPVTVDSCTQITFIDAHTGQDLGATISGTTAFDPAVHAVNPQGTPGEKPTLSPASPTG